MKIPAVWSHGDCMPRILNNSCLASIFDLWGCFGGLVLGIHGLIFFWETQPPLVWRVESNLPFPQVSFKDRWMRLSTGKFHLYSCSISWGADSRDVLEAIRNVFICFVFVCHVAKAVLDRNDFREKHCCAKLWNRPFGLGPEYF